MKRGYVYILRCSDGSYYTGSTIHLKQRLQEHQSGKGANYTRQHLPVELVYAEEFPTIKKAFEKEKQIQRWSHKKKEALIQGQFEKLSDLAKCQNKTHFENGHRAKSDWSSSGVEMRNQQ